MSPSRNNVLPFPATPRPYVRPHRELRRVTTIFPRRHRIAFKYHVTYFRIRLECGHDVLAFDRDHCAAIRRVCPCCSHAARLSQSNPVIPFPVGRKQPHEDTAVA